MSSDNLSSSDKLLGMDGRHLNEAHEECSHGSYAMDFSSVFRHVKRARLDDRVDEDEKATRTFAPGRWQFPSGHTVRSYPPTGNTDNILFLPENTGTSTPTAMTAIACVGPWRLPSHQSLAESQQYLNEQLQHVVALSSVLLSESEKITRNKFMPQERAERDDVDRVCSLDVTSLWTLLAVGSETQTLQQQTAERGLRDVLDLVSFLLYVRERELAHQNGLSESLSRAEKQLERKNHIIQTLASGLETFKQNSAQRENVLKAKEQALLTERKTLQMEKKERVYITCN